MSTINQVKQRPEADTPLLFFECVLPSGDTERWSTHSIGFNGQIYSARVLKHNLFDLQLSADDAMDGISQLSLTLANADSAISELNSALGLKGSQLSVYFAFADLPSGSITTESTVLFRGIAGDPDLITEDALTLSFSNKLSLQRIPLPEVRIQRTCPWNFPSSVLQRTEAKDGGAAGRFSRFFRCGYSADIPGGVGNLSAAGPYTSCDKSRTQCLQRGMFDHDAQGNLTRRFGAFEFVPSAVTVRTAGDKTSHLSPLLDNSAKFNDPVPLIYGTGWLKAPVVFSRNDGNLTHMEVLLCAGAIQGVLKVVVNDVEIPQSVPGKGMTATGWYSLVTAGTRSGDFNLDFTDAVGDPLGDPYGSLAICSVIVPNRISTGRSLPNVEVLLQGLQLDAYAVDGTLAATSFSNNPAWVILDILKRCGWSTMDLNLTTFVTSAASCEQLIATTDLNGNAIQVPRYQCNLLLTKRQSAAVIVRGIRVAASLMLRYGPTGLLELLPESTLAAQQPALPDGGNSTDPLDGGWPAYEFSDGSAPFSGIARTSDGASSVRLSSRSVAESSNRLSVEFQDQSNEYQQDSLSIVNADDSALLGYEITSQSTALGIANFSQATRVLLRQLDKSTKGNLFLQFQTSFRALNIRPGDIIAFTYLKEGFSRTPFRVIKLSPTMNYQMVTVMAQVHDDDWYSDNLAVLMNAGRQPGSIVQTPRPLIGQIAHNDSNGNLEYFDFGTQEQIQAAADGSATDTFTVSFSQPVTPSPNLPNLPLVSLSAQSAAKGGTLASGSWYYAVSAVDALGNEGALSFTIPVLLPPVSDTNQVTIGGFSFPKAATQFHVYRGLTPQELYRITPTPVPLDVQYTDKGSPAVPAGPPDASFDHANFYYRYEYAGPFLADLYSVSSIGWSNMGAVNLAYTGALARIIEGTGRGQERLIASNTGTTLSVTPNWSVPPDASSRFVVVEGSWKFAAVTSTTPARFEIAYKAGTAIQILGRSANVHNQEADADLCPITRCVLGGGQTDMGIATIPAFTLSAPGAGALQLSQIGFGDLTNTSSVTSGTLQLFSWNELLTPSPYSLAGPMDNVVTTLQLNSPVSFHIGDAIQIGSEIMTVTGLGSDSVTYNVGRGALSSSVGPHGAGDAVLALTRQTIVVPFAPGFFENRASQNFIHPFSLPDGRVSAAEFYVTNSFGDSQSNLTCYVSPTQTGLRTLSGGQFSIQVSGFLSTQQNAAPPVVIEASHAVRDIRASLVQPATGYTIDIDLLQNGSPLCSLEIDAGSVVSNAIVDGSTLPALAESGVLTMNVWLTPITDFTGSLNPGRDLTVTIRL